MTKPKVKVWVQRFRDRPTLQLQWMDPNTGQRKTKSAATADADAAEIARAALEHQLNAATTANAEASEAPPVREGPEIARHEAEAWYAHWSAVWEALPAEDQAEVIEQARREHPLFTAGREPSDYALLGTCLRLLESRAGRRNGREGRRDR